MFHNRIASAARSHFSTVGPSPAEGISSTGAAASDSAAEPSSRLILLPPAFPGTRQTKPSVVSDLLSSTASRCASFFAEAAVLVLVLGILDRFMLKGRIELGWFGGAFLLSFGLLAAAIATDVSARRWLRAH